MDLAQLIRTRKGQRTFRDLERDCDHVIGHARWQQLATRRPRDFPSPRTITAIAAALSVSEEAVLLSAGESLGLKTRRRSRLLDLIPDRAADLPDHAVNAILVVIATMISIQETVQL